MDGMSLYMVGGTTPDGATTINRSLVVTDTNSKTMLVEQSR